MRPAPSRPIMVLLRTNLSSTIHTIDECRSIICSLCQPQHKRCKRTQGSIHGPRTKVSRPIRSCGSLLVEWCGSSLPARTMDYRGQERFPFCSTFKVLVASAILKHSETHPKLLKERIRIREKDIVSWAPILENLSGRVSTLPACVRQQCNIATTRQRIY